MKRISFVLLLAALLGACSSPPKPPQCTGDFKPVNQVGSANNQGEGKRHGD